MESLAKINVYIRFSESDIPLGQIVLDGKNVLFKYNPEYLKHGYNVSPKKIQFNDSIQQSDTSIFHGLFGVFGDSLPDSWGNLLLKRALSLKQIAINQLSALDRLAYVGENGTGALIYKPEMVLIPVAKNY